MGASESVGCCDVVVGAVVLKGSEVVGIGDGQEYATGYGRMICFLVLCG